MTVALSAPHQAFLRAKREEERAFVTSNIKKKVDFSLDNLRKQLIESFTKKVYKKCLKLGLLFVLKVDKLATPAEKMPYWQELCECLKDKQFIKSVISTVKEILGMLANNGPERSEACKQMVAILGTIAFWFVQPEMQPENDIFWYTVLNAMTAFIVGDFNNHIEAAGYLKQRSKLPGVVKSLVFSVMKQLTFPDAPVSPEQVQSLFTLAKKSLIACPQSQNIRLLYNDVLLMINQMNGLLLPADEDGKKVPTTFPGDFRLMDIFRKEAKAASTFTEKTSTLKIGILQYPNNKFYQKSLMNLVKTHKAHSSVAEPKPKKAIDSDQAFKFCMTEKNKLLASVFGKQSDGTLYFNQNEPTLLSLPTLCGTNTEAETSREPLQFSD